MKVKFNLILVTFIYSINSFSQTSACGIDSYHHNKMINDSVYRNQIEGLELEVRSIIEKRANENRDVLYTIPVVVHVIHLGEALGVGNNIPDVQILDAIDGLNNRWRNIIGSGVDLEIEFCMATRDPNGNPTTGINRVNGSGIPNYSTQGIKLGGCSTGAIENDVKILSRWPVLDYYNIWVVREICNGSWGGWTYYPNGGVNDGATISDSYMTGTNSLLTHEVGHGFFAYHTFEGDGGDISCPLDTNCFVNGDEVCDTPPHKESDCSSTNPCSATGIWYNSRYNYMSYCSGDNRFTQDQKDRIRAVANSTPRISLLSSLGCGSPLEVVQLNATENIFTIYPNPNTGVFTIDLGTAMSATISIKDMSGRVVMSVSSTGRYTNFDLQKFANGLYTYEVMTSEGKFSGKLVKE